LIICPACGSNVQGDLRLGCPACGARAVGPALARAEHELPSFGRASLTFALGVASLCTFLGLLVAVLVENKSTSPSFWTITSAGEIAAWRAKFVAVPLLIVILIASAKIVRSIKQSPSRYIGLRAARIGFSAAIASSLLLASLIGITIPARLRQRQYAIEAGMYARAYTLHRAMLEYREVHGTFPTDPERYAEALRTLPDPDGSIAEALRYADPNGYQATTQIAAASTKNKPLVTRGVALRNVSPATAPEPTGVSFTSYQLRFPSEHRLFASDDAFVLQDGVITKVPEGELATSSSSRTP